MIAALDTEGRIWCSLTQANTDADVMCLFIRKLAEQLDRAALWVDAGSGTGTVVKGCKGPLKGL